MPTGNRPRPKVAAGKSPRYNTSSGSYSGKRGSKSPTGSRPTPNVAKNTPRSDGVPGATKPAIRNTPMPAPKQRWGTRGGGKPNGGK